MEKAAKFEELIKKVAENPELLKQCADAINAGKADELLKEMGYDFTLEELTVYLEEKNEDLSAEELEMVAGGRRDAAGDTISLTMKVMVYTAGLGEVCKL